MLIAASAQVEAAPSPDGWSFRERVDPITDLGSASAWVSDENGKAQFLLVCSAADEQVVSLQYLPGRYLGSREVEVIVRPDKASPISTYWETVLKGAYERDWQDVVRIATAIADAKQLTVRAMAFDGQPVDASFAIAGARAKFNEVLRVCGKPPL
jgi:hypothetical protein